MVAGELGFMILRRGHPLHAVKAHVEHEPQLGYMAFIGSQSTFPGRLNRQLSHLDGLANNICVIQYNL